MIDLGARVLVFAFPFCFLVAACCVLNVVLGCCMEGTPVGVVSCLVLSWCSESCFDNVIVVGLSGSYFGLWMVSVLSITSNVLGCGAIIWVRCGDKGVPLDIGALCIPVGGGELCFMALIGSTW